MFQIKTRSLKHYVTAFLIDKKFSIKFKFFSFSHKINLSFILLIHYLQVTSAWRSKRKLVQFQFKCWNWVLLIDNILNKKLVRFQFKCWNRVILIINIFFGDPDVILFNWTCSNSLAHTRSHQNHQSKWRPLRIY